MLPLLLMLMLALRLGLMPMLLLLVLFGCEFSPLRIPADACLSIVAGHSQTSTSVHPQIPG